MTTTSVWTAVGWTFLHVLWLGLILGLFAAMLRRLQRRARPEIRHGAALVCLLTLAVTPFIVFAVVHRPVAIAVAVAVESNSNDGTQFRGGGQTFSLDPPPVPSVPPPPAPPRGSWVEPIVTVLPGVWLAGSLLTLGSLATGLIGVERLRRSSVPLEIGPIAERCRALLESLGIVRNVGVAVCDRIAAPMLIGIARPLILLPSSALSGWSADQIEMALLHELAHLRRWDNLVNLLRRLVESLLFFHPVTWWLSAWVRLERELCCDRLVVDRTGKPRDYARWLAELAGCEPGRGLLASGMTERPLTTRIRRILNMEDRSMRSALPEVLGLCAAVILGAALTLPSLAESPSPKPDDEARAALARLSASAAAAPSDGDLHQRNSTLLTIAHTQIGLGDRVGALATLNRVELLTLPKTDAEMDQTGLWRLEIAAEFAEARYMAGDAPGALAQFRRISDLLITEGLVPNQETIARFERILADQYDFSIQSAADGPTVVDFKIAQADDARDAQAEEQEASENLMGRLELLTLTSHKLIQLGEPTEARPMIDHMLKLIEPMDASLKQMMGVEIGRVLTLVGDADRGREIMAQSRKALRERPDGPLRLLTSLGPMIETAEPGDLDEAITLIKTLKPEARLEGARLALQMLTIDKGTANWLDSGEIKITIGGPSLAPRSSAVARDALPKLAALIRSWDDAKEQARTLSVVAHLQARAGDFNEALETAESIPDVRRTDYPGPSDGFYDSIKPATFALIAAAQAEDGDRNGADSSFARARALTGEIETADQKLVAQIVLSDKLASSGRVAEAKEVLAEAFPLAAAQPEPRRSRVLCMLVENQVKAGDLAGAAGNIEAIRDEPGIQKARALHSLARALRDKGDAEGAAAAARRAIARLAKAKDAPLPDGVGTPGGISRDQFLDFDQESHPVLVKAYLQSMLPGLRILAGESEQLVREAETLPQFQRDNILRSLVYETAHREGLERAVEQAEALEAADARLAAIEWLARDIRKPSLAKQHQGPAGPPIIKS